MSVRAALIALPLGVAVYATVVFIALVRGLAENKAAPLPTNWDMVKGMLTVPVGWLLGGVAFLVVFWVYSTVFSRS